MSAPTVDRIIRSHASRSGARPALVSCGRSTVDTVTWRMLDEATGRLATHLSELAARRPPSCLVVSVVGNDLAELLTLVACLRVDTPVLVVSGRQPVPMHDALLAEVHRTGHTLVVAGAEPPEVVPPAHPSDSAAPLGPGCLLLASGGSTGHPKLVVDRGIRATPAKPAVIRPFLATGWRAGQRQLVCSPLYHAAGLAPFVEGLASGNTAVVPAVFDAHRLGDLVDAHAVDWLQMTPFHMAAILGGTRPPATWHAAPRLLHVADHCPPRVKRAFHEALDPTHVHEMYTASEGIGMTMARGDEWEARPGTVGRGFLTKVRVADADGRPLEPHQTGEVYLRSGARVAGTYLRTTGRLRITPDGFATLGDIGHLDEDGYLYLRPRQLATISVAGVTVSPTDVEAELMEHPQVADVGVCAQVSAELGERVAAVVVPAGGELTRQDIHRWAQARLGAAQVPARYVFAPALPRRDTGKLDRAALFAFVNGAAVDPERRG